MAGLFTLNSETLGLLDTSVLAGLGTDFFDNQTTVTASIVETVQLFESSSATSTVSESVTSESTLFASSDSSTTVSESVTSESTLFASVTGSITSSGSVTTVQPSSNAVVAGDARHLRYLLPEQKKDKFSSSIHARSSINSKVISTINVEAIVINSVDLSHSIYAIKALNPVVIQIDPAAIRRQREEEMLLLEIL